jgi:peptidoglycan/LPS O-acetylase OafA/YrhL
MKQPEIPSLTGLRFVAAFAILVLHTVTWCVPFNDTRVHRLVASGIGSIGMPLFFVLSGFVIHYNYAGLFRDQPYRIALRQFLAARFARIYPLFFFFFLVGAVVDVTAAWTSNEPRAFLSYVIHYLTLTQSWVYTLVYDRLILNIGFSLSWSLSCEFFFYAAYTAFVFYVLRLKRSSTAIAAILVFSSAVVAALVLSFLHMDALLEYAQAHVKGYLSVQQNWVNSFHRWFFYFSPYARVWEFALGCLTAQLFIVMQTRKVSETERAVAAILLWLALAWLPAFAITYRSGVGSQFADGMLQLLSLSFGDAVPLAIIIFCAARYRTWLATALSHRAIVYLGEISYSIYAVHTWILRPFIRPATNFSAVYAIDAIFRVTLAMAFTIIVAAGTYALIEQPCRKFLRTALIGNDSRASREPDIGVTAMSK